MSHPVKDGAGASRQMDSTGDGSLGDPTRPRHWAVLEDDQLEALTPPATGTAGTPSAAVLSVQGVAGGTAQPVSVADGSDLAIGAKADAAASSDAGTFGLIALFKRLLGKFPAALGQALKAASFSVTVASDDDLQSKLGALTETAPANDTASSGINGRLQRIAQNLATYLGSLTETAPASDTASSGLNGRLQRIAQRLTSLIDKFANDSTDKVRTSIYGKASVAGDTALLVDTQGKGLRVGFADTVMLDDYTTHGYGVPDSAGTGRPLGVVAYAFDGPGMKRLRTPGTFKDLNTVAITTIATVWTPAASRRFRLMGMTISVSSACSVLFEDNSAGTTIFRTPQLSANTPYNVDLGNGKASAAINNVLKATASTGTVAITGTLYGTEEI